MCLQAVKYKPPQGSYLYDVLASAATEAQIWNYLWRTPRTTQEKKIKTLILPINVENIHWYVAILHLDNDGVKLNIQNDINMRNKIAEDKLMKIGMKYQKKRWAQTPIPNKMVTPLKNTSSQIQTQRNSMLQNVNRPRQIQNQISRCLNFNKENQLNEKSECNDISIIGDLQNDLEKLFTGRDRKIILVP